MNPAQQLAGRFREVILNGTFIANTNWQHQLTGTDWQLATRQVDGLNTLAILAQHIHYYIAGVLQVLQGGTLDIRDKFSFDFPPVTTQQHWDNILDRFWTDAEAFAQAVEQLSDEQLQAPFVDEKYGSYLRNIDAMIEHSYYHLGQIVLLKKMLLSQKQQ